MYYSPYQSQKKIPVVLAVFLIVLMVFLTNIIFTQKPKNLKIQADENLLKKIEITNISYNSASILYRTKDKTVSSILYSTDPQKIESVAYDDRDMDKEQKQYFNHYVTLKNLKDNTKYYFYIVYDKKIIKKNNLQAFDFSTKLKLNSLNNLKPVFGKVIKKTTNPLVDGLITLKIDDSNILSTRTKETGEWLIPLYYLTKNNTNEFFIPKDNSLALIEILDEDGGLSTIKADFSSISPIKEQIVVGENYDLRIKVEDKVLGEKTKDIMSEEVLLEDGQKNEPLNKSAVKIILPKENASLQTRKPLFKGTSYPGSKNKIIINKNDKKTNMEIVNYEMYSDNKGNWSYSPFFDLNPDNYTFIIFTKDENNKAIKLERNFTVSKSGESVLGSATGSAVISPTRIISPTKIIKPSGPPATGANMTVISTLSVAFMIMGIGLVILF